MGSIVPSELGSLVVSSPVISGVGSLLSERAGVGASPATAEGSEHPSSDLGAESAEAARSALSSLVVDSSSFLSSEFVSCSVNA